MKIVRHVAPDMRQALRSIRAQLGEDAVILSSRRIPDGVEVTAAVDFDANALQEAMNSPAGSLTAAPLPAPAAPVHMTRAAPAHIAAPVHMPQAAPVVPAGDSLANRSVAPAGDSLASRSVAPAPVYGAQPNMGYVAHAQAGMAQAMPGAGTVPSYAQLAGEPAQSHAAASHYFPAPHNSHEPRPFAHILGPDSAPAPQQIYAAAPAVAQAPAPVAAPASARSVTRAPIAAAPVNTAQQTSTPHAASAAATASLAAARREPTLNMVPVAKREPVITATAPANDTTGAELKTLRRMLETQLAQLAWNDLTRRAPAHVEVLRELTEIGISQDLCDYILKQLPEKVELAAARRFAISGLSQYLLVTGDRWLENGGRVAFIGATGVGKTTTLAKLAVRWVLRHGPRDLALVGSDTVRIGAQDQIQSLGQLLGVPVYTPETFESLPTLLARLGDRHRMILIDTPGSSLRDTQLASRLGVLSNCASQLETALVLGASTQAGAIEETVKRFAPANPACCVLTKLDEAASLGGALSALIRARLPVSYLSEGQRVPEDLRPARSLELVSTAVRLAKASGAAADEDLLRRRFGKTANAST